MNNNGRHLINFAKESLKLLNFDKYKSNIKSYDKQMADVMLQICKCIGDGYKSKTYCNWIRANIVIDFYLYLVNFLLAKVKSDKSVFISEFKRLCGQDRYTGLILDIQKTNLAPEYVMELLEYCSSLGPILFSSWNFNLHAIADGFHKMSRRCSKYIDFILVNKSQQKKWKPINISTVYDPKYDLKYWINEFNNELLRQEEKFDIPHILPIDLFYSNLFSCFVNIALRAQHFSVNADPGAIFYAWEGSAEVYKRQYTDLNKLVEQIKDHVNIKKVCAHLDDLEIIREFQDFSESLKTIAKSRTKISNFK